MRAFVFLLVLCLPGCASLGFKPSHGTGAADLGATQGFGLEASPYRAR